MAEREALAALFAGKPQTLSVSDVAQMLDMSTKGVYRWIREGVIPAYKVGATWFVLRDELHEKMREGSNHGGPQAEDDSSA